MNRTIKILNFEDAGVKYFHQGGKKSYVFNSILKPQKVEILFIALMESRNRYPKTYGRGYSRKLLSLFSMALDDYSETKWDSDFIIVLMDGRLLEVCAKSREDMTWLLDIARKPESVRGYEEFIMDLKKSGIL